MNTFTAVVHKEEELYVAECPEIGTASQGETIEEAVNNLKEATELYLEAIKVFMILGFQQVRQKGSHVVMRRREKGCVIPRHKELAVGTLRSVIRQAGISVDEFVAAYKK